MWDEVRKYFAAGSKRHPDISAAAKDMALADVRLGGFLTNKYALWLDLRTTDDDQLHGSGRRISEGMTIQIQKEAYEHRRLLDMRRRPRYPRWPIRPSSLLTTSCRGRRIRRSYVGRQDVEKVFVLDLLEGSFVVGGGGIQTHCHPVPHHTTQ